MEAAAIHLRTGSEPSVRVRCGWRALVGQVVNLRPIVNRPNVAPPRGLRSPELRSSIEKKRVRRKTPAVRKRRPRGRDSERKGSSMSPWFLKAQNVYDNYLHRLSESRRPIVEGGAACPGRGFSFRQAVPRRGSGTRGSPAPVAGLQAGLAQPCACSPVARCSTGPARRWTWIGSRPSLAIRAARIGIREKRIPHDGESWSRHLRMI